MYLSFLFFFFPHLCICGFNCLWELTIKVKQICEVVFYWKLNGAYINKTIFSRLYYLFSIIAPSLSLPFSPVGERYFSAPLMLVLPMRRSADMRYINIWTEVPWAFALGHENSMLLMTYPAAQVLEWETLRNSPGKPKEIQRRQLNHSQPPALTCLSKEIHICFCKLSRVWCCLLLQQKLTNTLSLLVNLEDFYH